MAGIGEADLLQALRELWNSFRGRHARREYDRRVAVLEMPWRVLALTGNHIGNAPASIRQIAGLDEEQFDELYLGELLDKFWHQYTIYAATPFAVHEVLEVLQAAPDAFQPRLLEFVELSLKSELSGDAPTGSHGGIWYPPEDQARLRAANIIRPTVSDVVLAHWSEIARFAETANSARDSARKILQGIG